MQPFVSAQENHIIDLVIDVLNPDYDKRLSDLSRIRMLLSDPYYSFNNFSYPSGFPSKYLIEDSLDPSWLLALFLSNERPLTTFELFEKICLAKSFLRSVVWYHTFSKRHREVRTSRSTVFRLTLSRNT